MSYDLAIYVPRALSVADVHELIGQGDGLQADGAIARSVTARRGARRRYSFTVDGPDAVDTEDLPTPVTAAVLGVRWIYSVNVEGSVASEIPHAVKFARRLAQVLDGAVVDQQTNEVWSRSKSRVIRRPERGERVSTIEVAWYCLRDEISTDAAALFLEAAQRFLPEAVPRRFGEYEPLQGKLADSGPTGFTSAWTEATTTLYTAGAGPCIGGHLGAGDSRLSADPFWSMSLTLFADAFREPRWHTALRTLFITLADELPAFYASAEVVAGNIWTGRSLWSDADTEWQIVPVRYQEGWTGLPPKPTWWTWLGSPFAEYQSALPRERTTETKRGVLYEASSGANGEDTHSPLSDWLPSQLFSTLAPNPDDLQPVPLTKASAIPGDLRDG